MGGYKEINEWTVRSHDIQQAEQLSPLSIARHIDRKRLIAEHADKFCKKAASKIHDRGGSRRLTTSQE